MGTSEIHLHGMWFEGPPDDGDWKRFRVRVFPGVATSMPGSPCDLLAAAIKKIQEGIEIPTL